MTTGRRGRSFKSWTDEKVYVCAKHGCLRGCMEVIMWAVTVMSFEKFSDEEGAEINFNLVTNSKLASE